MDVRVVVGKGGDDRQAQDKFLSFCFIWYR